MKLQREKDGTARLRLRFTEEDATLIEEAAGDTPIALYIHRLIRDRAKYHIAIRDRRKDDQQATT